MSKPSIEQIKWHLVDINESSKNFITRQKEQRDLNTVVYEESTVNDYIQDIGMIIGQLEYLTRSSTIFCSISTLQDRRNIVSWLSSLVSYFDNDDFTNIEWAINSIKPVLRWYYVFLKKDFIGDLQKTVVELQELKIKSEAWLLEIENTSDSFKEKFAEFSEEYNELLWTKEEIDDKIEDTEVKLNTLDNTLVAVKEKSEEIANLLTTAKSNEWIIENFSKKVESREIQLEKQELKTTEYNKKLDTFATEHNTKLNDAQSLIDSAREAMKYKTAEGISAAIQEQYDQAKSYWNTIPWLLWSLIFIGLTIVVWWMIVFWWKLGLTNPDDHWSLVVGRISLLPILIAGVIFTANRYTKQKHIIEDYAYKMVLAKSIIGFSEQLLKVKDTNDWYQEFIKQVLSQLLQDPLRTRKDESESAIFDKAKTMVSGVAEIVGKVVPK